MADMGESCNQSLVFCLALNHYRCVKVVTDTGAVSTTDNFKFLHHTLPVPDITPPIESSKQPNTSNRPSKTTQHCFPMSWRLLPPLKLSSQAQHLTLQFQNPHPTTVLRQSNTTMTNPLAFLHTPLLCLLPLQLRTTQQPSRLTMTNLTMHPA